MATTLTSAITELNISRLKRDLEDLGDIRVVSITPPKGLIPTTVVLTRSNKTNLTPAQETAAQNVIDNHLDGFDESGKLLARTKISVGTLEAGTVEFTNNGLSWKIGPDKNFIPVGAGRTIGSPTNPVNIIYANTIIGAGGGSVSGSATIYNEVPSGVIDNVNVIFTTVSPFLTGTARVYLNGLRLAPGLDNDYTETGSNEITLTSAPRLGDELLIDYDISGSP